MKSIIVAIALLLCSMRVYSQWTGIPKSVEIAFDRIERAVRNGDLASMEDLLRSSIMMRLEDTLYKSITCLSAIDKLKTFFIDKDSIGFRFATPGSRTMSYSSLTGTMSYLTGTTLHHTENGLLCDTGDRIMYYDGSGIMYYIKGGKRESTRIDVWLIDDLGDIILYALNISNHPYPTMFYLDRDH